MLVNSEKTKCMLFCKCRNKCDHGAINLNNKNIEFTTSFKLLGVTISNDLRWNIHIEEQLKTTRKLVFIILQLKRAGLTQQQLVTIYQAYIQSILMYGYPCFCNLPYSLFKSLKIVLPF